MHQITRYAFLIALIAFALPVRAELERIDAPVSIKATPALAAPGAKITLAGDTPFVQAGGKVQITVTPPAPEKATTLAADVDAKGNYSIAFSATKLPGTYALGVIAPDGKGKGNGSFRIVGASGSAQLTSEAFDSVHQAETDALAKIHALLTDIGDAPGRADVDQKLGDVEKKIGELQGRREKIAKALADFVKAREAEPGQGTDTGPTGASAGDDPVATTLGEVAQQSQKLNEGAGQAKEQIAKTQNGALNCDKLDNVIEMLNLMSTLMDLQGNVLSKISNIVTDKIVPAAIDRTSATSTSTQRFAVAEAQKVLYSAVSGVAELFNGARGVLVDIATFGVKEMYNAMCTRYEGPFDATFTAHMSSENAEYWSYTTKISGKLVLSEPKSAGDASAMSGRFEGTARGYQIHEDALQLEPKLSKFVLYHTLISPPGNIPPPLEENGAFFALKSPFSFYVRVKANREGKKMTLYVGDASKDISESVNRGIVYFVFNAGIMPMLVHQDLPMQPAQFILSRGMGVTGGGVKPVFDIVSSPGEAHIEHSFTRDEVVDNGQIKVHWEVNVKACSPSCSKSTIDKIGDAIKKH